MNNPAARDAELVLTIALGSSITVYRPSFIGDTSASAWVPLVEDSDFVLQSSIAYRLGLRLVAQDGLGNPIADPAWMIRAYTMGDNGSWSPLADRDSSSPHFLADGHVISTAPRQYRFTVTIPNSGIETTFGFSISRNGAGSNAGDDIVVVDDDFGPTTPGDDPQGNTPSAPLVAGDLAAPL